jgi:hypothetical protein
VDRSRLLPAERAIQVGRRLRWSELARLIYLIAGDHHSVTRLGVKGASDRQRSSNFFLTELDKGYDGGSSTDSRRTKAKRVEST